ncbi:hypothetical protein V8E53_011019 [Lactarius tabidus]
MTQSPQSHYFSRFILLDRFFSRHLLDNHADPSPSDPQPDEELHLYANLNIPSPEFQSPKKEPAPKLCRPVLNPDASTHANRLARPPRFPEIFEEEEPDTHDMLQDAALYVDCLADPRAGMHFILPLARPPGADQRGTSIAAAEWSILGSSSSTKSHTTSHPLRAPSPRSPRCCVAMLSLRKKKKKKHISTSARCASAAEATTGRNERIWPPAPLSSLWIPTSSNKTVKETPTDTDSEMPSSVLTYSSTRAPLLAPGTTPAPSHLPTPRNSSPLPIPLPGAADACAHEHQLRTEAQYIPKPDSVLPTQVKRTSSGGSQDDDIPMVTETTTSRIRGYP